VTVKYVFMLPKVENHVTDFSQYETGFLCCSIKQEFLVTSVALWDLLFARLFSGEALQKETAPRRTTKELKRKKKNNKEDKAMLQLITAKNPLL